MRFYPKLTPLGSVTRPHLVPEGPKPSAYVIMDDMGAPRGVRYFIAAELPAIRTQLPDGWSCESLHPDHQQSTAKV